MNPVSGFLLALVFVGAAACGPDPEAKVAGAEIVSFAAAPANLEGPGVTTLSWETKNAVSLALSRNGSAISLGDAPISKGEVTVPVGETSLFELIAVDRAGGTASAQQAVMVTGLPALPSIGSFTGPAAVEADELGMAKATLSWTGVIGASELVLEADNAEPRAIELAKTPDGDIEVALVADTNFTLVAAHAYGETTATTTVKVLPHPSIDTFTVSRDWVGLGDSVELSWTTTGVAEVELWVNGSKVTDLDPSLVDGTHPVDLSIQSIIELRGFSEARTMVSRQLDVTVGPPLLTLSGSSQSLWLSETLHLTWTSQGGTQLSVTVDGETLCETSDLEEIDESGCDWLPPLGDHLVEIAVTNGSGVTSEVWPVHVGDGPRIGWFSVSPAELSLGDEITVVWSALPDPDGVLPTLVLRDGGGKTFPLDEQEGTFGFPFTAGVGSFEISLEATTDHPLSSPAVATGEVLVHGVPEATLTANPTHLDHTVEGTVLTWTSEHASSLVLYEVQGEELTEVQTIAAEERAAGSTVLAPLEDTTYRIVAISAMGLRHTADASVTVADPEILSLTADVSRIKMGEPVLLTWDTRMADEVSFNFESAGYIVGESDEPFIDAAAEGGTHLPLSETDCGNSPLTSGCVRFSFPDGFTFPFDGVEHAAVRVYHNGFLSFTPDHATQQNAGNTRFPVSSGNSYRYVHIAPFWDYLAWQDETNTPLGNIHYLLQDDPVRGRSMIIQWKNATFQPPYRGPKLNFEVVLWERGGFEFRYGEFEPGTGPTSSAVDLTRGSSATIGYQTPSQSSAHTVLHEKSTTVFGELFHRTFTFKPAPTLAKSGSYLWYPLVRNQDVTATLKATRGSKEVTQSVSVRVFERPEIALGEFPSDPIEAEADVRLNWTTKAATALQVLDQTGTPICTAADQAAVDGGYCVISESVEGKYTYRIRATGEGGTVNERIVGTTVYAPLEIESFTADKTTVDQNEPFTLSWATTNLGVISLTANGQELLPPGTAAGPGELVIPSLSADTTFVLRLTNTVGMSVEKELFASFWTVSLEVSQDLTDVRPGTPVTLTFNAADLGGGAAPVVYGSFPMKEVANPPAYVDISTLDGAMELMNHATSDDNGHHLLSFPAGFEFPFFGQRYVAAKVMYDGYLSFNIDAAFSGSNVQLPYYGTTESQKNVNLAPFWDDLHRRAGGSLWGAQTDPDTFVIQWKGWSKFTGSSATVSYDLNFQIVLHRDGSFEYRYGTMAPPPPPNVNASCHPNTCENDANGSSATIGYAALGFDGGSTFHFGGAGQSATNVPFPGGLSGKIFRYEPVVGSGQIHVVPTRDESYAFCVEKGGSPACKWGHVKAAIGIDSFTLDEKPLLFGQSTHVRWTTHGGARIRVLDADGVALLDETDLAVVDSGSLRVTASKVASYTLELTAPSNRFTASAQAEVIRAQMSSSAPAATPPGVPVSLSWNLAIADPDVKPIVIAPMVETSGLLFSELDLSYDSSVTEIFGASATTATKEVPFPDGFTFEYLGEQMSSVRVSVDGYLSFELATASTNATNVALPSSTSTTKKVHLAPFWDDLSTLSTGRVIAKLINPDTYVIQWSRVSLARGSINVVNEFSLNFLVVLHRNGDFEFRYGEMLPPFSPSTSTSDCYPNTCVKEANGGAATIGYQDPSGRAGFLVHYAGASSPSASSVAVPKGLRDRSWKFTKTTATVGSVPVAPTDPTFYNVCAIDTATKELFCPEGPVAIDAAWGVAAFDVNPWAPRRGAPVTLSWETLGLDELRLLRDGAEVFRHTGGAFPPVSSLVENVPQSSTYVLEGSSLGRMVSVERRVEVQTFEMSLAGPPGRFLPGEAVNVQWTITPLETGTPSVSVPMVEIDAGPGQPGRYVDITTAEGAKLVPRQGSDAAGVYPVDIPFDFPYFGKKHSSARATVDGYLSFDLALTSANGLNKELPNSSENRVHLAVFWDQLQIRGAGEEVWTHSPDADTFIIQWTRFNRWDGSSATVHYDLNWQIVLFSDGSFEYRYGRLAAPPTANNSNCRPSNCTLEAQGSSATIGYQSEDGRFGQTFHFGGDTAATVKPFPGGDLQHRSFRFQSSLTGSTTVTPIESMDYTICAALETFTDCETLRLRAVADPGDLMVTELMILPAGGQTEQWFEVRNLSRDPIDLNRFVIANRRDSFPITSSLVVPPLGHAVFAASTVAGHTPAMVYGTGFPLDSGLDQLQIHAGTSLITILEWDGNWRFPAGETLFPDPSEQIQGRPSPAFAKWCTGSLLGSPGATDVGCQSSFYDVDPNGVGGLIDISSIGTRIRHFETTSTVTKLPIPGFSWRFFGSEVKQIWAAGNGWLSFSEVDPTGGSTAAPAANAFPRTASASPKSPILAAFWDTLTCRPLIHDCAFTYYYGDVGGERVFIAEWRNVRRGTSAVGGLTFQAQLWEDGDVKIVFGDVWTSELPQTANANYYRGSAAFLGFDHGGDDYVIGLHRAQADLAQRVFHFKAK